MRHPSRYCPGILILLLAVALPALAEQTPRTEFRITFPKSAPVLGVGEATTTPDTPITFPPAAPMLPERTGIGPLDSFRTVPDGQGGTWVATVWGQKDAEFDSLLETAKLRLTHLDANGQAATDLVTDIGAQVGALVQDVVLLAGQPYAIVMLSELGSSESAERIQIWFPKDGSLAQVLAPAGSLWKDAASEASGLYLTSLRVDWIPRYATCTHCEPRLFQEHFLSAKGLSPSCPTPSSPIGDMGLPEAGAQNPPDAPGQFGILVSTLLNSLKRGHGDAALSRFLADAQSLKNLPGADGIDIDAEVAAIRASYEAAKSKGAACLAHVMTVPNEVSPRFP
ncbi:hypothetical protein HHL28_18025 [Aerophototrophica crusticola]|uniref:Uncharacterized protein n=1 Tax=Aerophototrophica crusticola TaxID=1709002 RepID=A0A858RC99_9PROT|nr:hypothetical protein HHL28_18025 [Rhodospirillaceae bacterium B3]